jgi:glycosyltransferase involved in cell wall biosynthesis
MRILALEPYYGGSHKAFLDGWSAVSNHQWTVLKLPAYKWKWRMRHSAITFAEQLEKGTGPSQTWDLVFCSDMLNLAEFLGLAPASVRNLPTIAYFHENQLTYPNRFENERDYQFAVTNLTAALSASSVWFNSAFHRDSFLNALAGLLKKMPDYQPMHVLETIAEKALVFHPGIPNISPRTDRKPGPMRILWAARWEHDKKPEFFFEALGILKAEAINFRISVIGEQFRQTPEVFKSARKLFDAHIDHWGYRQSRVEYERTLAQADVIVSTAEHEFFGISVVEAIAAGAYPLLPKRLAYPEILELDKNPDNEQFFYDAGPPDLARRLADLAKQAEHTTLHQQQRRAAKLVERLKWPNLAPVLDKALENVLRSAARP